MRALVILGNAKQYPQIIENAADFCRLRPTERRGNEVMPAS